MFADDSLEDSEQLCQTFLDHLLEILLTLFTLESLLEVEQYISKPPHIILVRAETEECVCSESVMKAAVCRAENRNNTEYTEILCDEGRYNKSYGWTQARGV